ncbi:hypothetical protein L2E82_03300 [Cichorium intybus]|uniref:Uncharacterized protein n=1 Tax=Cichorium intybus TaxID=13427 RepID=A0ACB9H3M3_CICIN|nr:hypothetical protein L2E82_03300 [Cichorium intybus]
MPDDRGTNKLRFLLLWVRFSARNHKNRRCWWWRRTVVGGRDEAIGPILAESQPKHSDFDLLGGISKTPSENRWDGTSCREVVISNLHLGKAHMGSLNGKGPL